MPTFGENILQGFFGAQGVRDYTHASKVFLSNDYELTPRYKFLFHVFFNINTAQIPSLQAAFGAGDVASIGLTVKTAQLPSYTMDVETMNQYNRKRLVQTKLNYNPVQIVFNDDQGDLIRNMWYNYYSYYYKDPSQKYESSPVMNGSLGQLQTLANGFGYNNRDIYSPSRQVSDWGYIGEAYQDSSNGTATGPGGKPPFFRDIKIYGLSQKKFASWVLINPMITEWLHDTYDYSAGNGTMVNTMTIRYETVKYYSGAVGGAIPSNTVSGFADPAHYDTLLSPLARNGSRSTVFGQGGLIDAGIGIFDDLEAIASGRGGLINVIGAVQQAGTAYNTFKGKNIANFAFNELKQKFPQTVRQYLPGATRQAINAADGMIFPRAPTGK